MDRVDLVKQKAKYDKLIKKRRHLSKKIKKAELGICKEEKEMAHSDMLAFINNIQTSKNVPDLLKKRKREATDRDATPLIEHVFGMDDGFLNHILVFLGPMEYYNFSRTNKRMSTLLIPTFDAWALQFLDRIEQETPTPTSFEVRKLTHLSNFELFTRYKKSEPAPTNKEILPFVYQSLAQLDETFQTFRPQRDKLFEWVDLRGSERRGSNLFKPSELSGNNTTVFVYDTVTKEVSRATEHNLLLGDQDYPMSDICERREKRFRKKYGFPLEMEYGTEDSEYLRYKDLMALKLARASDKKARNRESEVFFIEPTSSKLIPLIDSDLRIITMRKPEKISDKWKGKLFCDEYECRCIIQRQSLARRANYAFVSLTGTRLLLSAKCTKIK